MSVAKVNALRALEEAAEAIGWSVGACEGGLGLFRPSGSLAAGVSDARLVSTTGPVPVELMALLLAAAR